MVRLLSPAKVNFGLWITGRRADGFHEIVTLLRKISLYDVIYIKEGKFKVDMSLQIEESNNLVYKALKIFSQRVGKDVPFSIYIEKNIPAGSGLGGGSSNVAVTLKTINELMDNPLPCEELKKIACSVSSDAPFFFEEGSAVGRGKGELLEYLSMPSEELTIIYPGVESSTRRIYSCVREKFFVNRELAEERLRKVIEGELEYMENVLGDIAKDMYPEIGEVIRFLEFYGIKPFISGSGSAVFYIGKPFESLEISAKARGWKIFYVRTVEC